MILHQKCKPDHIDYKFLNEKIRFLDNPIIIRNFFSLNKVRNEAVSDLKTVQISTTIPTKNLFSQPAIIKKLWNVKELLIVNSGIFH